MNFQSSLREDGFEGQLMNGITSSYKPQTIPNCSNMILTDSKSLNITLENRFESCNCIHQEGYASPLKGVKESQLNEKESAIVREIATLDVMPLETTNNDKLPHLGWFKESSSPYYETYNQQTSFFKTVSTSAVNNEHSLFLGCTSSDDLSATSASLQNTDLDQIYFSSDSPNESFGTFGTERECSNNFHDLFGEESFSNEKRIRPKNQLHLDDIDFDFETVSLFQSVLSEINFDNIYQSYENNPTSMYEERHDPSKIPTPLSYLPSFQGNSVKFNAKKFTFDEISEQSINPFKSCAKQNQAISIKSANSQADAEVTLGDIKPQHRRGKKASTNIIKWIYDLLCQEDQMYNDVVKWTNRSKLEFCIRNQHKLAGLWGQHKCNPKMNFNKFA